MFNIICVHVAVVVYNKSVNNVLLLLLGGSNASVTRE